MSRIFRTFSRESGMVATVATQPSSQPPCGYVVNAQRCPSYPQAFSQGALTGSFVEERLFLRLVRLSCPDTFSCSAARDVPKTGTYSSISADWLSGKLPTTRVRLVISRMIRSMPLFSVDSVQSPGEIACRSWFPQGLPPASLPHRAASCHEIFVLLLSPFWAAS